MTVLTELKGKQSDKDIGNRDITEADFGMGGKDKIEK